MQLKVQAASEFQTVQVYTFKTTFRIGRMSAGSTQPTAARNSLIVEFQSWMVRG